MPALAGVVRQIPFFFQQYETYKKTPETRYVKVASFILYARPILSPPSNEFDDKS